MDFLKSRKGKIFVSLIVISILIGTLTFNSSKNGYFSSSLNFIVVPIQETISSITSWTSEQFKIFTHKNYLAEENERLFLENEELKVEVNRLKQLEEENRKLSELLETEQRYPAYEMSTADIIAKNSNYWYDTFIINKGSNDGVEYNMVVLANGGLVGRITEVGPNYSKVTSIINEANSVSVKNSRTGDLGILKGSSELIGDNLAIVEYLDLDSNIVVGDEIVTSHLSDIYPSNLVVGTVINVYVNDDNVTKSAIIEPTVDFKKLDKVLIVKDFEKENYENELSEVE